MARGIQKEKEEQGKTEVRKGKLKIPVTFNQEQLVLIDEFKGIMGDTNAEIVRNIVINWLLDKRRRGL